MPEKSTTRGFSSYQNLLSKGLSSPLYAPPDQMSILLNKIPLFNQDAVIMFLFHFNPALATFWQCGGHVLAMF